MVTFFSTSCYLASPPARTLSAVGLKPQPSLRVKAWHPVGPRDLPSLATLRIGQCWGAGWMLPAFGSPTPSSKRAFSMDLSLISSN